MRRRDFIGLAGGAAAWPLTARAQQPAKVVRIGFLGPTFSSGWADRLTSFRLGLNDLGYVEGKNFVMELRWADEQYSRLGELAAELVALKVDFIVTYGTPGVIAAKQATTTIPIIMVYSGDAVSTGLIASLARPGGNVVGSTYFLPQLMAKRLELLKEAIPSITQAAVLVKPDNPLFKSTLQELGRTAAQLNIDLQQFVVRNPNDLEAAFSEMTDRHVEALVIQEDAMYVSNATAIVDLATRKGLALAGFNELAKAGGLIGYGVDFREMSRRAAVFVDKILRGAKPADIPVEQATKFEVVLNMRTAKALGFVVPTSLLLRANEVIE